MVPNSHMKTFHCLDCSMELPSRHALNQHKITCKKQYTQKVYSCYACGSTFYSPRELTDHKREIHLGIKQVRGKEAEAAMAEVGINRRGRGRRLEHAPDAVMISVPPGAHILSEADVVHGQTILQAVEVKNPGAWAEASTSQHAANILTAVAAGQKRKAAGEELENDQILVMVRPEDDEHLMAEVANHEQSLDANHEEAVKLIEVTKVEKYSTDETAPKKARQDDEDDDDNDHDGQLTLIPQVDGPADSPPKKNLRRKKGGKAADEEAEQTEVMSVLELQSVADPDVGVSVVSPKKRESRMVTRRMVGTPKAKKAYSPTPSPTQKKVASPKAAEKKTAPKPQVKKVVTVTAAKSPPKASAQRGPPTLKLAVPKTKMSSPAQKLLETMQGNPRKESSEEETRYPIKTYSGFKMAPVGPPKQLPPGPLPLARESDGDIPSDKAMTCCDCLAKFPTRRDMSIHKSHACPARKTAQYPYKCACRLAFQTIEALARHGQECRFVPNHTRNSRSEKGRAKEYLTCLDCGELFHRVQLANHKRNCTEDCKKPKFPCEYCSHYRALTRTQLNEHVKAYHPEATGQLPLEKRVSEIRSKMKTKTMTCFDCGNMVPTENFQKHKWHDCEAKGRSKIFTCFHCHEMFASRRELAEHKKDTHLRSGTAFMCGQCHAMFDVYIDLYQHYHDHHSTQISVPEEQLEKGLASMGSKQTVKRPATKTYAMSPTKMMKKQLQGADGNPLASTSFDVAARTGEAFHINLDSSGVKVTSMEKGVLEEGEENLVISEPEHPAKPAATLKKVVKSVKKAFPVKVTPVRKVVPATVAHIDICPQEECPKKDLPAKKLPAKAVSSKEVAAKESPAKTLPSQMTPTKTPLRVSFSDVSPVAGDASTPTMSPSLSPGASPSKMKVQKIPVQPGKDGFVSLPNVPGVRMLVPTGNNEMLCVQCQTTLKSVTDIASHKCSPTGYRVMVKTQSKADVKAASSKDSPTKPATSPAKPAEGGDDFSSEEDQEPLVVNKADSPSRATYDRKK